MEKQGKTQPEEETRKGLTGERWGVKGAHPSAAGLGRTLGSFYPASFMPPHLAVGSRTAHRGRMRPHMQR